MINTENPYVNRNTIRDPQMFFGRYSELTHIYSLVAGGQNVSIVGDRRIGKSSLLYCLTLPEIQTRTQFGTGQLQKCQFIYIDLQGQQYDDPNAFFHLLLNEWQRQTGKQVSQLCPQKEAKEAIKGIVDTYEKERRTLVFLLDEFDRVTLDEQLDEQFFSFLRSLASRPSLSLVTASQRQLSEMCHTGIAHSPFFNIFGVVALRGLTTEAIDELLTKPWQQADRSPTKGDIEWILDWAGTHPFFLHVACFYLFHEYIILAEESTIQYNRVEQKFCDEMTSHFQYAWKHLDEKSRQAIICELSQGNSSYTHYLAGSRAFRSFVQSPLKQHMMTITYRSLRTALNRFDDLSYLGNCPLADLQLVRQALTTEKHAENSILLGRSVQKVLIDAIAKLKPGPEQTQKDTQWNYWVILHKRYIEGIGNSSIWQELHLAERTFFRQLKGAIKLLLITLQNMEDNASG